MGTGTDRGAAKAIFALGVVLFLAGLAAVAALYLVPVLDSGHTAPVAVYIVAMGTPLGLFLAIAATVWQGRRR